VDCHGKFKNILKEVSHAQLSYHTPHHRQWTKKDKLDHLYKLSIFIVAYVLECRIRGEIV
jgi:hypothetical protein